MRGVPETSELSQAEVALIDETYARHRKKSEWELTDFTHTLPEWRDPKRTSTPIPFEKILRAAGATSSRIRGVAEAADADWQMDQLLATAR